MEGGGGRIKNGAGRWGARRRAGANCEHRSVRARTAEPGEKNACPGTLVSAARGRRRTRERADWVGLGPPGDEGAYTCFRSRLPVSREGQVCSASSQVVHSCDGMDWQR